jgi:hypothetical protein
MCCLIVSRRLVQVPYDRLDGAKVQCGTCKQIITLSLSTELPPHKLAPSAVPDLDKP